MNPATNSTGCEYSLVPRPRPNFDELLTQLFGKMTTVSSFDPEFNLAGVYKISENAGQMMATRITEFLMEYPVGINCNKFVKEFPKFLGYTPNMGNIGFSRLGAIMWEEKDIFWTHRQSGPVYWVEDVPYDIFFPACFKGMVEDIPQILSRLWRKYCAMVKFETKPLPFTEAAWEKFESYLIGVDHGNPRHVFHYSDWGFDSHEVFVQICFKKWQNQNFHILAPGTVIIGKKRSDGGGQVLEKSIYYGLKENIRDPEDVKILRPLAARGRRFSKIPIPMDCSLVSAAIRKFTDEIDIGNIHKISIGDAASPHLFGVITEDCWYDFSQFLNVELQELYSGLPYPSDHDRVMAANLEPGRTVVVHSGHIWHRANIIRIVEPGQYLVYLMDWAQFTTVDITKMRYMKRTVMDYPAPGVLCKFSSPEGADRHFKNDRTEYLDEIVLEKFKMSLTSKPLTLEFIAKTEFLGQTLWEVSCSQLHDRNGLYRTPDLNRQIFLGPVGQLLKINSFNCGVQARQEAVFRKILSGRDPYQDNHTRKTEITIKTKQPGFASICSEHDSAEFRQINSAATFQTSEAMSDQNENRLADFTPEEMDIEFEDKPFQHTRDDRFDWNPIHPTGPLVPSAPMFDSILVNPIPSRVEATLEEMKRQRALLHKD